ncbi:MAG: ATP-dependent Clp protease ATP-binding subunit [Anaerolineales bacterium]|nr:ATP-dependent Clp protease ATP-binding subunit [Anaerolineales bacterium]
MERFTQRARHVLSLAQESAEVMNHAYIGTEHLLIGLLEEGGTAGQILKDLGLQAERVQSLVQRMSRSATRRPLGRVELAPGTKRVLELAVDEARRQGQHYIGTEHLLLGLVRHNEGIVPDILRQFGVTPEQVRNQTQRALKDNPITAGAPTSKSKEKSKTPVVDQLTTNLTELAAQNKLDPVIGRENIIERVIQILSRRTKNNPALIGEPGVGKTAIVEGLAQRIYDQEAPDPLLEKRLLQLDVGSLVAGTMYRGQFEERLKRVIEELKSSDSILFIDEVHMLVGAGAAGSAVDAANILKPALARGELQCIGATTLEEYRKHIESDAALERRFQPVYVDEPTIDETIKILHGIRKPYEEHHQLSITDDALEAAARLSARYVTDRFLPDKAIDLIDETSSRVRMYKAPPAQQLRETYADLRIVRADKQTAEDESRESDAAALKTKEQELMEKIEELREAWRSPANRPEVHEQDIAEVVSMWTGIPLTRLAHEETERLLEMESILKRRIVGQSDAIEAIAKAVRRARAGLKDPRRPIGSFLFLGPTGVGKTELAKALAEFMFGSEEALIQLDMSEFMERHTVARMIGSPPGYVGYEDAGQLTEAIRRRPYSIVIFDELEKAHPDAHNILLQIMEEGHLSDAKGRKTDFRNAIILMTSNIGAGLIKRTTGLGFNIHQDVDAKEKSEYDNMKDTLMERLKKQFRPEFINRVDSVVVFRALNKEDITKIVDLEVAKVNTRLLEQGLSLRLTDAARGLMAEEGYDPDYGARPLRRVIQLQIEDYMSDELLNGRFNAGDVIEVDSVKGKIHLQLAETVSDSTEEPDDTREEAIV